MMEWDKKGLIYVANNPGSWAASHASIPCPILLDKTTIRIYLTFCDDNTVGRLGYIDVDADNPSRIIGISEIPLLNPGRPGTFDDNGVVTTSVIQLPNGALRIYYVGFEICTKIRYRLFTGIAEYNQKTQQFDRLSERPALDRTDQELFFRCGSFCLYDEGIFKLWYVAGNNWITYQDKALPEYDIRYLESTDGIHWGDAGAVCIAVDKPGEFGFGRPYVVKKAPNAYQMFYSKRCYEGGYRLGYAESENGIQWHRQDKLLGFDVSATGWDSEMVCYSAIFEHNNKCYMFYNGNEFGKTGIGYALLHND